VSANAPTLVTDRERRVTVEMTLRESEVEKLHAWMSSEVYERAEKLRLARLEDCVQSLRFVVDTVRKHPSGGTQVLATVLASLYNGIRFKVDLSDLRRLDPEYFQHALNVIRLCFEDHREPHTYFEKGGAIFEAIFQQYGLYDNVKAEREREEARS